jgi:hypothetical protein
MAGCMGMKCCGTGDWIRVIWHVAVVAGAWERVGE